MSLATLYKRITTPESIIGELDKQKQQTAEAAALQQQELNNRVSEWLKEPLTYSFIQHLTTRYTQLIDTSENLSVAGEHEKASRLMIEARTIKNILTYARTHKYYGTTTSD